MRKMMAVMLMGLALTALELGADAQSRGKSERNPAATANNRKPSPAAKPSTRPMRPDVKDGAETKGNYSSLLSLYQRLEKRRYTKRELCFQKNRQEVCFFVEKKSIPIHFLSTEHCVEIPHVLHAIRGQSVSELAAQWHDLEFQVGHQGNLGNEWVFRVSLLFQLPRSPTSQEVMFLTIQVKGPTQEFKKRTTVLVKNEESLVFVQTDKPIYKPEQTGTEAYSQDNSPKERSSSLACFPVKGILVP